jgi:hypothetical protein
MKTKKLKPRKTKKGKLRKKKTRGGSQAYYGNQSNYENGKNGNNENWNRNNRGYRNFKQSRNSRNLRRANLNYRRANLNHRTHRNQNNNAYNADEEDYEEDIEQNYEDYQDYIEELTQGLGNGCTSSTLQEKLDAVEAEITNVTDTYEKLIHGISLQTLGNYIDTDSLVPAYSEELSRWHHNAARRASQFQLTSVEDLNKAFLYLLPSFDATKKFMILSKNDYGSAMHDMIAKYAYKMVTSLFTRSNITYSVLKYDERPSSYQFMENLLGVMRSASQITNQYLREDWDTFLEIPMDRTMFVHSGGNMTVMIAGMLCYLYEIWNSGQYQYGRYGDTLLEEIREDFEAQLMRAEGNVDGFYNGLSVLMQEDEVFRISVKKNTEKISDIDLIFMAPDYIVNNIHNPYLIQINELTAYVLRKIMVAAHRNDGLNDSMMAYHIMPFAGEYDNNWSNFKFSNMSGISPETVAGMRELHESPNVYSGYRQTSNFIEGVPMYLNRLKQGYQPFFDLDLSRIPEDTRYEYSSKYGECLDCSIGANTNPMYYHKQHNYMYQNYYTLDTLIYEFDMILAGPPDDKTQKRRERRDFLARINIPSINALFKTIGRHIT